LERLELGVELRTVGVVDGVVDDDGGDGGRRARVGIGAVGARRDLELAHAVHRAIVIAARGAVEAGLEHRAAARRQ